MPAKELYAANALASLHNGIAARLRRGSFAAKKICRSEVTYALHYRLLQRCMSSEDPCDIRILPHSVCLYFNNIHSQNVEKTPEKKGQTPNIREYDHAIQSYSETLRLQLAWFSPQVCVIRSCLDAPEKIICALFEPLSSTSTVPHTTLAMRRFIMHGVTVHYASTFKCTRITTAKSMLEIPRVHSRLKITRKLVDLCERLPPSKMPLPAYY